MRKMILALPFLAAGCASAPVNDIEQCSAALLSANTSSPVKLAQVAFTTPACVSTSPAKLCKP
jgi:hypothetical protein